MKRPPVDSDAAFRRAIVAFSAALGAMLGVAFAAGFAAGVWWGS